MKITKDFFKHVPIEKQAIVIEKLESFSEMIVKANVFHEIPKGFWIRKIVGTNIYKFRVNSGDRILFTFNENGSITYLSFETHDKQIKSAKRRNQEEAIEFVIDKTAYNDEKIDENINHYAKQELVNKLNIISQEDVMEDEYVKLLLEDSALFDSEQILTREQYEALNTPDKLTVVLGCAGSGKTNIGVRRLLLHQELEIPTFYVSHSPFLMNEIKKQFLKWTNTEQQIQFFSLHGFYEQLLNQSLTCVAKEDFILWFKANNLQSSLSSDEVYIEINTVIKGQTLQRMMTQEQYNNSSSDFSLQEKRNIYFIATLYQKWLEKIQYYDLNDLAFLILKQERIKIDSLVFDEIQELTFKQFESVLHVTKTASNHLLLGDPYQAIDNYAFQPEQIFESLSRYKIPFQKYYLNKNFRSGYQVVQLLNYIKEQEVLTYPTTNQMNEKAIRSTSTPKFIKQKEYTLPLLQKLDQDAHSILIVPTPEVKKYYQMQGFKRVFVVTEVQGLQYENVYCQDILQYFYMLKQKHPRLYKTYFHLMYVAASRTSKHIYFLEQRKPQNISMDYFERWDYQDLINIKSSIASSLEWMNEARKLELIGKYEQALDAYKKAKDQNGIARCEALLLRSRNYLHLETYLSIVNFNFEIKNPKQIECALQLLLKHQVQMVGRVTYSVTHINNGQIISNPYFIDPSKDIGQISLELYNRINYSYAAKYTLKLAGVFYQKNEPILLSEKFNEKQMNDLNFFEKNGRIHYRLANDPVSRQNFIQYWEFEKNKQPKVQKALDGFEVDVVIENARKKESADDFLNDIFQ
ncbi:UvrD-helicase domain-containing protein [Rossellomorea marisflavi]|uniref:UvrD-helicase domain-containing protein n=1 Tax=Rossellomorea marisflavi TaxID=189381 RepID=UPI0034590CFA